MAGGISKLQHDPLRYDDPWLPDFIGPSDRASAIAGAAYIDFALMSLLLTYLPDDISAEDAERIPERYFRHRGMLQDLSRKIAMAYFLGGISKCERSVLDTIRTVRNAFAHAMRPLSFEEQSISAACLSFGASVPSDWVHDVSHLSEPRRRFIFTVVRYYQSVLERHKTRSLDQMKRMLEGMWKRPMDAEDEDL
jgi:hypothetical protein